MFTGLVEQVGRLVERSTRGNGARLVIGHEGWDDALVDGESVAVQGACLTVTGSDAEHFWCDVLAETLEKTQLGTLALGSCVNLERAMRLGDRFGGHIVSGHVDETGRLEEIRTRGEDVVVRVACSEALARGTVQKGSITIDGISLTVTDVGDRHLEVNVIPFTWQHTSLRDRREGDRVNLESDILGKYVARLLRLPEAGKPVTMERLAEAGFLS